MVKLYDILQKSMAEEALSREETFLLLSREDPEQIQQIFQAAREMRKRYFGTSVFLYGFVYFSTYCRNDCAFCYYRKSNTKPPRYQKTVDHVIKDAITLKESGVHLIDLTMGEDPYFHENPEKLVEITAGVKKATGLPVMISPGLISDDVIKTLYAAGADWYALYQETHNRAKFKQLRLNQDYQSRLSAKQYAKSLGMLIEEGLLVGIGDTIEDTIDSFEVMERLQADQVRTMTFIPQEGTPLEGYTQPPFLRELLNIAVMRLRFPDLLIPASMDVDSLDGLEERLNAGANVVTSLVLPREGYAGVANASRDIDDGLRTVAGIQSSLKQCGLTGATVESYKAWIRKRNSREGRFLA